MYALLKFLAASSHTVCTWWYCSCSVFVVSKLTTAVGTINGLIFYTNIVVASPSTFFPYVFQKLIFSFVFISWLNLDLGIEICFFDGMDVYIYTRYS